MKDFLKTVGASLLALFIFTVIIGAIALMSIVGMVASTSATTSVKDNSVLVIKLSGVLTEQVEEDNPLSFAQGSEGIGLAETLSAIKKAKENDKIKGIYLEAGLLSADVAQLQEIRNALEGFKKSGKWIIAYGENYTQGCYYLASAANKIYLNPIGMVSWHGIGGSMPYLKEVLDKAGIRTVVVKHGKYKSAPETLTETQMSPAAREQNERYIGLMWQTMCNDVSKSRGIAVAQLNAIADQVAELQDPQMYVRSKLVDGLCYNDEIKGIVKKQLKLDDDDELHQLSVADMQAVKAKDDGDKIAVYYAYGDIVNDALPQSIFGLNHQIVAADVCEDLKDLADDDDVKAVVIRVNSGGGSSYASEQLWHAVEELKAKKPVVVSMGGMAASGGYYMSAGANYIVAEPTTLTGSIGIFGIFPDATDLMTKKIGIKYDQVATNRNTTMLQTGQPITAEQQALLNGYIDRGYLLFKNRVAKGRKMSMAKVEEYAQGHVFLGADAIKIGLVDALGGLDMAVAKAAQLAKVKDYYTAEYPGNPSFIDQLMSSGEKSKYSFLDDQLRLTLGNYYEPLMMIRSIQYLDPIQARLPYTIKLN